jgi:hypothetical protein
MTNPIAGRAVLAFACCLASGLGQAGSGVELRLEQDSQTGAIRVYRDGAKDPILTQNANADNRPYLHPIVAPDGKGVLTEYRPAHHPHQTGIFWGFKYVNGRDFFMKWGPENYRRVSAGIVQAKGPKVGWRMIYDMLDENGKTVMTETQSWTMTDPGERYVLDLEWQGEAKVDVTLGKIYVGGLFVRMPWRPESRAEAVNSLGQRDMEAEQQRAIWADLADQVDGRDDMAHIAVFDHPDNHDFPAPWRVDSQMGFGPNREYADWRIAKGKKETIRYRIIAYTGKLNPVELTHAWKEFVKEY